MPIDARKAAPRDAASDSSPITPSAPTAIVEAVIPLRAMVLVKSDLPAINRVSLALDVGC